MMKKLLTMMIVALYSVLGWCQDGTVFNYNTVEGVAVTYQIVSEANKTCRVGYAYEKNAGVRYAINQETEGSITIPSDADGYTVISIGSYAFSGCSKLTSISIPDGITSIGTSAFNSCTSVESINIPNTVTYFGDSGDRMFAGCESLKTINIPEGITSLGPLAFYGCKSLTSISLPSTLTSLGTQAFSGCSSLTSIDLPDNLKTIGYSAFTGCSFTTLTLPRSFTGITDAGTGIGTINTLKEVIISEGVSDLYEVFRYCGYIERVICYNTNPVNAYNCWNQYPRPVLYVPEGSKEAYMADDNWNKLTIIEMKPMPFVDANVKTICVNNWDTDGDGELNQLEIAAITDLGVVFSNRANITSFAELKYFTSLSSIKEDAFANCSNLSSITIPSSVTSIGYDAFSGCRSLTSVTVENPIPCTLSYSSFPIRANATLYVPAGSRSAYSAANYWKDFTIVELDASSMNITFADLAVKAICIANWDTNGDGELSMTEVAAVTDLGDTFASKNIKHFNELQFFTGLTSINNSAFSYCKLSSVTLPQSIVTIGDYAFSGCSDLSNISIPDGVTSIGKSAFDGCSRLSSITIPSSVSSIGSGAFSGCSGFNSFVVEEGNSVYDSRDNCNALIETVSNMIVTGTKNTIIPNSVTSIGEGAFYSQKGLTSITIPNNVTSIGKGAFSSCSGLTSIVIPNSITSIEDETFLSCSSLTSVNISNSVASIGSMAFSNCIHLATITIPEGVTSIKNYAFQTCTALEYISLPSSINSIGNGVFYECNKISEVTINKETPVSISNNSTFQYRSNATLYVPYGCKAAFETASYWNNFKEIIEMPAPAGTEDTPFTCAEANDLVAELVADTPTETEYYVKGKVCSIEENFNFKNGTATFWISDDGTQNGKFYIYRTNYFEGAHGGRVPNLGDEVILYGKLVNYQGTTPATASGECRLVSINDKTTNRPIETNDLFDAVTDGDVEMYFVAGCMTEPGKPSTSTNIGCSVGYAVSNNPASNSGAPTAIDCNYEGAVTIPEMAEELEVRTVAPSAFAGAKLSAITIPATVWDIETNAFKDCQNLASVTLPEGVTLNACSFQNCTALTSIALPKGVQLYGYESGAKIFSGCTNLTSITVNDETPYNLMGSYLVDDPSNVTLCVPVGSKAAYEAADYWKEFKEIVEMVNVVKNGDLEGTDVGCFYSRVNYIEDETILPATIVDGAGIGGSRGIVITSIDNPSAAYDTQFFLRLQQPLPAGTKYRLSFDYKASQEASVNMEAHAEPSEYIDYGFDHMTFNTTWQHYERVGEITEGQSPADHLMRTIAFDLSDIETATTYYLDNIVFEIDQLHSSPVISAIPESTIIPWGTEQAWEMKYVYFDEIGNGNEPGTDGSGHAWTDAEFDDSSWATLTGPIARYENDFSVVNTIWEKENSCYYLRRTFNLDEVNEQGYYFCSRHDDNVKVWINGTQVVDAGFNGRYQYHRIPASAFVKGTNTMAIYLDDTGGGAYLDYCMANFYFLKNVETGKYLKAGNEYGTHAILADEPLPARISKQKDGSYTIFFPLGSQCQQLLFRDGDGAWVDYDGQESGCPYWTITTAGEDSYHIQTLTTHETYGQSAMPGTYLGNNPDKEGNDNDVDGNIFDEEGMNITWQLVPEGPHTAAQTARLQELVTAANGLGLDTSGEETVLNNNEATYLNMLDNILELQDRINNERNNINAKTQDLNKLIACAAAIGVSTSDAQVVADNPQNMESVNNAISTLRTTYIAKLGEGVDVSLLPLDVTGAIINPTFAVNEADGWSWKDGEDYPGLGSSTAEYRERTFDFHQTVSGLPNGSYLLKVKGFHRPGNKDEVFADYMQGTDNAKAKLYANGKSVTLKNVAAEAQEHVVDGWSGLDVTYNEQTRYIPHENYDANTWFLAGYYENELSFTVTDGTLTFGISLDESVKDDWVCFDDFRLKYLGSMETDISGLTDAIYANASNGAKGGVATLNISLKNSQTATAYSFDLVLPEGVTLAKDNNNDYINSLSNRHNGQTRVINMVSEQVYKMVVVSFETNEISGNDGVVWTLKLNLDDNLDYGDYAVRIQNATYSVLSGAVSVNMPETIGVLTVANYTKGDVNGDGDVDIADAVCIVNYVVGKPTPAFNAAAADANGDGDVDIADAVRIVNLVVGKISALARQVKWTLPEPE